MVAKEYFLAGVAFGTAPPSAGPLQAGSDGPVSYIVVMILMQLNIHALKHTRREISFVFD